MKKVDKVRAEVEEAITKIAKKHDLTNEQVKFSIVKQGEMAEKDAGRYRRYRRFGGGGYLRLKEDLDAWEKQLKYESPLK
jgi:hypothetical protein